MFTFLCAAERSERVTQLNGCGVVRFLAAYAVLIREDTVTPHVKVQTHLAITWAALSLPETNTAAFGSRLRCALLVPTSSAFLFALDTTWLPLFVKHTSPHQQCVLKRQPLQPGIRSQTQQRTALSQRCVCRESTWHAFSEGIEVEIVVLLMHRCIRGTQKVSKTARSPDSLVLVSSLVLISRACLSSWSLLRIWKKCDIVYSLSPRAFLLLKLLN